MMFEFNNFNTINVDVSTFLKMLNHVHKGMPLRLLDGTVNYVENAVQVYKDKINKNQIVIHVDVSNGYMSRPSDRKLLQKHGKVLREKVGEKVGIGNYLPNPLKRYRRFVRKGSKPSVLAHHYREREKLGIYCRNDIKNFPLNKLPGLERDIRVLAGLGIETLGNLVGTGIAGLKYRIQKKYNRENPQLLGRLIPAIKQSIGNLGFRYANKHPHNENPDGSPRRVLN